MTTTWVKKPLGEVCTLQRGFDLPKRLRIKGKYPLVSSSGVIDSHSESRVKQPGVATGRSGSIGNVFFIEEDFWPLNTALYVKDFHGNDERFVYHLLNRFNLQKYASGAGVPTLNRNHVHDVLVSIPTSKDEQRRIVAILDEAFEGIDTAIANAEKNLQNAKELFESHLQSVFAQTDEESKETTIGKEVDLLAGFAFKSKEYTESQQSIRLLRGDNIVQGTLRWDGVKRWPVSNLTDYEGYRLSEGDVVLAMDRPWVNSGLKRAIISDSDLPSLLVQRVARLRIGKNMLSRFLFYLVSSRGFINHILGNQTGIGVPHVSGKQIQSFSFHCPTLKWQSTAVDRLDELYEQSQRLQTIYQQKLANLTELKQSILQKAFSGQLRMRTA